MEKEDVMKTKWTPIKRNGLTIGYIEFFWSKTLPRFVSIPGASRTMDTNGNIRTIED